MAATHIMINKTNHHKNHDEEFLPSPSSAFDPELHRPGGARSSSSPSRSSLDLHVIFITAALLFLLLTILALHFAIRCCLRRCFRAHSSSSSSSSGGGMQPPPGLPIASSRPATLKKKQLDSLPIITFHVIRPHDEEAHMPPRHHDDQNRSDNSNGANANATEGRGSCRPTDTYEHMSGGETTAVCAICLAEFTAGEGLRRLPACGHVFHATCVGTWLASHSASCPICRASPLLLDRPSNYTSSSSSSPPPPSLELRILITTPSNPKPLLNPN